MDDSFTSPSKTFLCYTEWLKVTHKGSIQILNCIYNFADELRDAANATCVTPTGN